MGLGFHQPDFELTGFFVVSYVLFATPYGHLILLNLLGVSLLLASTAYTNKHTRSVFSLGSSSDHAKSGSGSNSSTNIQQQQQQQQWQQQACPMPPNLARPFAGLETVDFTGLRLRLIDAEDQIIGRLAAQLSILLQGKDKPIFAPHKDHGDVCIVVNAERAVFTGNKWEGKLYKWHTGYPGALKEISAKELWRRDPSEMVRRAVYGMLPRNNLRDRRMRKLRVFPGPEHPFKGVELVPWQMPPRQLQDRGLGWIPPQGFEPMNPKAYLQRMRGSRLLQEPQQLLQQQQQPQQLPAGGLQEAGLLVGQSSSGSSSSRPAPDAAVSFEDLLSAEERAFVQASISKQ